MADEQVTSETPTTKPAKNPRGIATGKLIAEKTGQAREVQKKAAAETAAASASANTPQPTDDCRSNGTAASAASSLSSTQWLAIGSFVISLIDLYYKREEVKAAFSSRPAAVMPVAHAPPPAPSPSKTASIPWIEHKLTFYETEIMAKKVDVLQLLISNAAIFGIRVIWFNFNKKVFTMVRSLLAAPFSDEECEPTELNT